MKSKDNDKPRILAVGDLVHLSRNQRLGLLGGGCWCNRKQFLKKMLAAAPLLVFPQILFNACGGDDNPVSPDCSCEGHSAESCTAYDGCTNNTGCPAEGDCNCQAYEACSCEAYCSCDSQCSCEAYCSCDAQCTCESDCSCDAQCSCDSQCTSDCPLDGFTCPYHGCLCEVQCGCQLYRI